jgi:hypothetical protein
MSLRNDEESLLRDYLLGRLDETAREQVEERLLDDDDFEESLSAAQDALIDDYVFDTLSAGERQSFDKNFVIDDERRRKMLFAQTVKIYLDERDGRQSPWKKPLPFLQAHKTGAAISAAVVLLVLLLTPAALRLLRPPDEAALQRERRDRLAAQFNQRPADQSIEALPTSELDLQPMLREESVIPRIILNDDIRRLILNLTPPEKRHDEYKAALLPVEGEELFTVRGLKPGAGGAAIPLNIPTEFLRTGDYEIQLRGAAEDAHSPEPKRYYFRVIGKQGGRT